MASPGKKAYLLRIDPELWAEIERLAAAGTAQRQRAGRIPAARSAGAARAQAACPRSAEPRPQAPDTALTSPPGAAAMLGTADGSGIIRRMNPLLARLHPYPFERWRELTQGITPPAHLRPISLGIGEPKHATPALIQDALIKAMPGLASYPATAGEPALREAITSWLKRRYGVRWTR
jgi:DNA-binding transcriptional MocR family regulator